MKTANGLLKAAVLVLGGVLVFAGCGGGDDNDRDTEEDTETDPGSDLTDSIPDPTTEPPDDVPTDSVEDSDAWGDGEVGDPCTLDTDCGGVPSAAPNCLEDIFGMITFPGGYCSADCTSDDDCGPDGDCIDAVIMSLCLKTCTSGSDCRESEGYTCDALPDMLGIPGDFCLPPYDMPDIPPDGSTDVYPDTTGDITGDATVG